MGWTHDSSATGPCRWVSLLAPIVLVLAFASSCSNTDNDDRSPPDRLATALTSGDVEKITEAAQSRLPGLDTGDDELRLRAAKLYLKQVAVSRSSIQGPTEPAPEPGSVATSDDNWLDEAKADLALAISRQDKLTETYLQLILGEEALRQSQDDLVSQYYSAAQSAAKAAGVTALNQPLAIADARKLITSEKHLASIPHYLSALSHYSRTRQNYQARRICDYLHRSANRAGTDIAPEKWRDFAEETNLETEVWRAICLYSLAARFEMQRGSDVTAGTDLEQAYQLSTEKGEGFILDFLLNSQAMQAQGVGDVVMAIAKLEEGIVLAEATRNEGVASNLYNNLAFSIAGVGDYRRAQQTQQKAIDLALRGDPDNAGLIQTMYLNMGDYHFGAGENEAAIEWYMKAREVEARNTNPYRFGDVDVALSHAYFKAGRLRDAVKAAEAGLGPWMDQRKPQDTIRHLGWLATLYAKSGDLQKAATKIDDVERMVGEHGPPLVSKGSADPPSEVEFLRNMTEANLALGRTNDALRYAAQFITASDRRFDAQQLQAVANADVRAQLRDRDRALELAAREKSILALEVDQSRLRGLLAGFAAISTAAIAFGLYRSYRSQQKIARTKDICITEIHHRTKNNLQVLASLFRLEERLAARSGLNDPIHQEAANRARVMGLVQEHLYGEKSREPGALRLDVFLEELLALVGESYGSKQVALKRDMTPVEIDGDFATPVGLIACELVTNAYKHAFAADEGAIEVALSKAEGSAVLTISDNGAGINAAKAATTRQSIGLDLVHGLAKQIGAVLKREEKGPGTRWRLEPIPALSR